ncbi:MAG: response regulator [Archangium sp.]|nr:response regulator [Archangium sp.]
MLDRVTGYFFPVKNPGEDQRARAQLVLYTSLGAIVASLGGIVVLLIARRPDLALVTSTSLACGVLTLVVLRASRSVRVANQVLGGSLALGYGLATVWTRDPSLLLWLAIAPVVMLLLTDIKQALPWFAAGGLVILGLIAFLLYDPSLLTLAPPRVLLVRAMIFLATLFGLTLASAYGRERTQRSLEEARDEAHRANALKSQFLASFSHEIRTPLNGVLGTADALLAGPLAPDVREQLLIIQRSGSSLLRTINDVLELSRIEAGRLDLFPVATDLPALLREVVELFQARAAAGGLALRLELDPGHPRHVKVDDLRLRQVVQNLVGNAVKFTQRGQVVVRLAAGPVAGGHVLTRVSVEDTGPGIEPEAVKRLFSAFSQARPRTDRAEGAGLGLAISNQFVELMDGKLTVDTTPGRGSSFHVELTLPLAEEGVAAPATVPAALEPGQRLKVLVVDDNEINLKVAVALLTRLGHELSVARDGQQALTSIAANQPDVVFMDCHMPVLDGLEATRRLRAAGDGRPVVALTASVYSEDQENCRKAGMNHFVSKPVTLLALQSALREVSGRVGPLPTAKPVVEHRRVLVVDDDPHVRRMTVRMLRAEGFEVNDAGDVESALILFERARPSHLLVDQVLGGSEDGLHFAERLSRLRPGLRVVVTSGRPPSEQQLATLEAAGGRFLAKPYNRRMLIAALTMGLERAA